MQGGPTVLKEGNYTQGEMEKLKEKSRRVSDVYESQLRELFLIKNPRLLYHEADFESQFPAFLRQCTQRGKDVSGNWVYYEWSNILLHTLSEDQLDELRTNRNRDIITIEEQKKLRDFTVAIAGLSVGSNIASVLAYNGFSKNLKVADFDTLETTNLNRVRAKLSDIGSSKLEILSQQIYELDPYANIIAFDHGLNEVNIANFLADIPKANLIFEIIDDLKLKILIRKEAKKHGIPVVMLTSIGDSVMIDVERYDIDQNTQPFNGLVAQEALEDILQGKVSKEQVNKYVTQIVGKENAPTRAIESLKNIGKTLVGRPQLMSTVTVASGFAGFIVRKIALGEKFSSGRILFKFDDLNDGS